MYNSHPSLPPLPLSPPSLPPSLPPPPSLLSLPPSLPPSPPSLPPLPSPSKKCIVLSSLSKALVYEGGCPRQGRMSTNITSNVELRNYVRLLLNVELRNYVISRQIVERRVT